MPLNKQICKLCKQKNDYWGESSEFHWDGGLVFCCAINQTIILDEEETPPKECFYLLEQTLICHS